MGRLSTIVNRPTKATKVKPSIRLDGFTRENVVEPMLAKLRTLQPDRYFMQLKVSNFGEEHVIDEGGVARECWCLFFEQLHTLERTYRVEATNEEKVFKLFELTAGGKVRYLVCLLPVDPL